MIDDDTNKNRVNMTDEQESKLKGTTSLLSQDSNEKSSKDIKLCYVFTHMLVIALGFMQFGLGMSNWTPVAGAFACLKQWDIDAGEDALYGDIIQSVTIFGAAIGALSCAKFLSIGKLKLLLILNVILVTGVTLSIITDEVWLICVGRFIWGLSYGAFSVTCAKMVNECAPVEYGGSFGALNQLLLTLGAAIPGTIAINLKPAEDYTIDDIDTFEVKNFWRVVWAVGPLTVAVLQVVCLLTCFRNESPVFLREKGREEELLVLMKKYYSGMEIKRRIDALEVSDADEGDKVAQEVSMKETFFDPKIRKAAWVGFFFVFFQQFTGINSILFFSAQLFGGGGLTGNQATVLINYANFTAAGIGAGLLGYFGRKTLMIGSMAVCIIGLFGMFIFDKINNDTMQIVLSITFIFGFEFGPGPIVWLYLSEVCNDKATSFNTVMCWFWTLFVSLTTTPLTNALGAYLWLMYGCIQVVGFVFYVTQMKETRGLTKEQQKRLYRTDNNEEYDQIR